MEEREKSAEVEEEQDKLHEAQEEEEGSEKHGISKPFWEEVE